LHVKITIDFFTAKRYNKRNFAISALQHNNQTKITTINEVNYERIFG